MRLWKIFASALLIFSLAACATTGGPVYPGKSLANQGLKNNTMETIKIRESFYNSSCKDYKVVDIEVIEQSTPPKYDGDRLASGKWAERWTVDICGKVNKYKVEYSVNSMGAGVINLNPPTQDGGKQ